jgi:hypothetical protein
VPTTASAPAAASRAARARWSPLGQALALDAPVQVDDDDLGLVAGRLHGGDQPVVVRGRDTGRGRSGGPGAERAVADLAGREQSDAVAADGHVVRRVRPPGVGADPDRREAGRLDRGQRVGEADRAVVGGVVVGHRRHVDAGRTQRRERGRGGAEVELLRLGLPRSVTAVSRLTMVRSAARRAVAASPNAVSGFAVSRAAVRSAKCTSPANASVIGRRVGWSSAPGWARPPRRSAPAPAIVARSAGRDAARERDETAGHQEDRGDHRDPGARARSAPRRPPRMHRRTLPPVRVLDRGWRGAPSATGWT